MTEPLTLDEAITHAEDAASQQGDTLCGDNHRQLAKWLTHYRELLGAKPRKTKVFHFWVHDST
jgi:hypothetical protein